MLPLIGLRSTVISDSPSELSEDRLMTIKQQLLGTSVQAALH